MRVLLTAGPTREPLDPVRFLSNRSSGRMGYALARALLAEGHQVVLVTGPTALRPPAKAKVVPVETAEDMLAACRRHWSDCDAVVGVAAVADYRPARHSGDKLKRTEGQGLSLELVPNPDILATLAKDKGGRLAVGFALESGDGKVEALRKLRAKNLDFVVLNGPEAQGAEQASLRVFDAIGKERHLGPARKPTLAKQLVRWIFGRIPA
ncbi:MAG: phosphopantothenoylcysteine decarboxylase [Planctomycetota bacterium]|nr:MAG: phosphopantothenoylcysteine decarboxylase [Planctomycetota bacterium]